MWKNAGLGLLAIAVLLASLGTANRIVTEVRITCEKCHSTSISCHIKPDALRLETIRSLRTIWDYTIFHSVEMKEPFDHGAYMAGECLGCHPNL
jgi:hypothetical protein